MIVGEGKFRFEVVEGWEQLPAGWWHGDVADVATDSRDRVYVFNRSDHPVIVYDRDGRFLTSWGEGVFTRPHGITITADDIVWLADDTDHTVRKCTLEGTILQTLGTLNQGSDTGYEWGDLRTIKRGAGPFNRPTRVSLAQNGDLYISDGYGNARVHRFTAAGEYIQSWGEPGKGPGEFNLPHSVWVHRDGRVFVCDRENNRMQVSSPTGEYLSAWTNVTRPMDLWIDADDNVFLAEGAWKAGTTLMTGEPLTEDRAPQLSVRDLEGNVLARWGGPDHREPGSFGAPHGIWLDSRGDLYVAEVIHTALSRTGEYNDQCVALQKFARV